MPRGSIEEEEEEEEEDSVARTKNGHTNHVMNRWRFIH